MRSRHIWSCSDVSTVWFTSVGSYSATVSSRCNIQMNCVIFGKRWVRINVINFVRLLQQILNHQTLLKHEVISFLVKKCLYLKTSFTFVLWMFEVDKSKMKHETCSLFQIVEEEALIKNNNTCKDFLIEAMKYHLLPADQRHLIKTDRTRPRTPISIPKVQKHTPPHDSPE